MNGKIGRVYLTKPRTKISVIGKYPSENKKNKRNKLEYLDKMYYNNVHMQESDFYYSMNLHYSHII